MSSLYQLKPAFQGLLRPLVRRLAPVGVTANQVTVLACLGSVAAGAWLAVTHRGWLALPVYLFVRMALNAMDGMLAKEHGQASRLGAILNELGDLVSDAALVWPIATLPGWDSVAVGGAVFFAALTEFAGVLGPVRRFDGPFGKSDRAFALGVLGTWLGLGWPVAESVRLAAPYAWMALCVVTVIRRARGALR